MELEKSCEFCLILRPIVYCKADAAHLCLSCDAKVHSANALSYRHPRTLVCEACRCRPAYVQCPNHRMFMCRGCDCSQHDLSSQHPRKVISWYIGCPSAKDFAGLWGLDLDQLDNDTRFQEKYLPTTSAIVNTGLVTFNNPSQPCLGASSSAVSQVTSTFELPKVGSIVEYHKALNQNENMGHILHQILDLKRLQLTQVSGNYSHSYVRGQEEADVFSFENKSKENLHENLSQQLQQSLDLDSDHRNMGSLHEKPNAEPFPFAIPQMDGDSFWQCKSPVQSSQVLFCASFKSGLELWTQNMQDLGVCDDIGCLDDFSMPDVDLTFKNIEELFGGEQELARALLDNKETTCSSMQKDMSIDISDKGYERSVEDVSAVSSACISHTANLEKDFSTADEHPSISFSFPMPLAEFLDSGQSSDNRRRPLSFHPSDLDNAHVGSKENVVMRYKEKKKIRRCEKQSRHASRKARSDVKKLVRDQFVKAQEYES